MTIFSTPPPLHCPSRADRRLQGCVLICVVALGGYAYVYNRLVIKIHDHSLHQHPPPTFLLRPQQNSPRLSESHAATVDDDADRDESFRRTEMVNSIFELFPAPLFANSSAHPSIFHLRGRRWTAAEPEFMFREHFIHVFLFRLLPSTSSPVPPALWDVFPAYSWGWKVINFISFSISVPLIYLWTRRSLSLALVQHSFIIIIINIIIYPSMRRNGGERTGCDDPSKMTECEAIKSWHVVLLSPHSPLTAQCSREYRVQLGPFSGK